MVRVTKTVCISLELNNFLIKNKISPSKAIEEGINLILAEEGIIEYNTNLKLFRKMLYFKNIAEGKKE